MFKLSGLALKVVLFIALVAGATLARLAFIELYNAAESFVVPLINSYTPGWVIEFINKTCPVITERVWIGLSDLVFFLVVFYWRQTRTILSACAEVIRQVANKSRRGAAEEAA